MKAKDSAQARAAAAALLRKARIAVTQDELETMEIADLGLGDIQHMGLEVIVYENNDRYCAKELVLLPRQICPEHRHPRVNGRNLGKKETFRCRYGEVYLYVAGERTPKPKARVPQQYKPFYRLPRDRAQARRPVHAAAEFAPLVPGRRQGGRGLGVLLDEHGRERHLLRPPHPKGRELGAGTARVRQDSPARP